MTIKAVRHFLVYQWRMWFPVAGLALRHNRMLAAVTEGTGECLVLGLCFLHQLANFLMTCHAEGSRRCQGIINLQRMMGRVTSQTVTGHLAFSVGLMTRGTIGDLAVYIMTERTGLLSMGTFIIDKILTRSFVAGKAGLFYIIGKVQGKGLMGIRMAGKAVLQFIMGFALVAHGALRDNIFTPGRMLSMTVKAGNCCLVLAAVTGDCCRGILVTFHTIGNLKANKCRACVWSRYHKCC